MRVITGYAKGHKLLALEGSETRPTTDKVKEALFSIIQRDILGCVALDLFSGSGSLGIEALSRGAMWCDFVDQSKSAATIIESNLKKTHLSDGEIHITTAHGYLASCKRKYDIVFLDPPYKKELCDLAMHLLCEHKLLNDGALIICETSADEGLSSPYHKIKEYKYGNVKITVFENR